MADLESENTRKTGEIIRLAHQPVEYVYGFDGGENKDLGLVPLPDKPGFVLNQKTCAIEPAPISGTSVHDGTPEIAECGNVSNHCDNLFVKPRGCKAKPGEGCGLAVRGKPSVISDPMCQCGHRESEHVDIPMARCHGCKRCTNCRRFQKAVEVPPKKEGKNPVS